MSETPATLRRTREAGQRRDEILTAARKILHGEGVGAFSIQRLSDVSEFSRPTIYKYFPTKEEVLVALAIDVMHLRCALIKRVDAWGARPRERMLAVAEINVVLFPHLYGSLFLVLARNVQQAASAEAQERLKALVADFHLLRLAIVEEAVADGDLVLPSGLSPTEVIHLFATTITGVLGLVDYALPIQDLGVDDAIASMRRVVRTQLDAIAWRPLSKEWDYEGSVKRIYEEVFPPELVWEIRKKGEPDILQPAL